MSDQLLIDQPAPHSHPHPDFHPRGLSWSGKQTLHVAVAFANPCRWHTRRWLMNQFRQFMRGQANIKLYVGEVAYGDLPFEVTSPDHPNDYQFRTRDVLWLKERLLNRVILEFDKDWEYGAYIDGDCHLTRQDWGLETISLLQHYDFVQMFSSYGDLGPNHEPLRVTPSFAYRYMKGEIAPNGKDNNGYGVGTTGLAWAFRRDAFDKVGTLLDTCPLGSADWHMAFGLIGAADSHPQTDELTKSGQMYAHSIEVWQRRAAQQIRGNVGCVTGFATHYFHGSKINRKYGNRWEILRDNNFDPYQDLYPDHNGIWQLTPNKPKLRDDIRRYFASRNEDARVLEGADRSMIGPFNT